MAHLAAVHDDRPEQHVFFAQSDGCLRAVAADVHKLLVDRVAAIRFFLRSVGNLRDALTLHDATQRAGVRSAIRSDEAEPPPPLHKPLLALDRGGVELLAIERQDVPIVRFAQPHCLFEHGIEYWREIARRGVDDLQYLGRRGLLLQRLARLRNKPCVLHRNDRLRGEVLQ